MPPDYDCVVVGAGLVGASQALALSQLGLNVLSIDARGPLAATTSNDVRGLALAPSSRALFEQIGVWPRLAEQLVPIRHIHVSEQGRFGVTRLAASDVGFDALGYVCPADHLLRVLEDALIEQCEVRWHQELDDIEVGDEMVRVHLRDAQSRQTISARLVVGADGPRSQVRECTGILIRTYDYQQSAMVANLSLEHPLMETAFERFTKSGPLALLPLHRDRHVAVRCVASSDVERLTTLSDAAYLAELEVGFGHRFGSFSALGKRTTHPLVLASAERIIDERVALVGAAAASLHPNGAQGLNLGLRDVAALTRVVSAAHATYDDIGGELQLTNFARNREHDHRSVARFTDGIAKLFSNNLLPLALLRNGAMLALDLTPPAKRWLIRRASGLFAAAGLPGY